MSGASKDYRGVACACMLAALIFAGFAMFFGYAAWMAAWERLWWLAAAFIAMVVVNLVAAEVSLKDARCLWQSAPAE